MSIVKRLGEFLVVDMSEIASDEIRMINESIEGKLRAMESDDSSEVVLGCSMNPEDGGRKQTEGRTRDYNVADGLNPKKKRAKRRYFVNPVNALRNESGIFQSMYQDLRQHPEKFFDYYGMSMATFDELLDAVRAEITKKDIGTRVSISAEERLTVTLRYLVHGIGFSPLSTDFMIGHSTMSGLVRETCTAIWKILTPTEMAEPSPSRWKRISEDMYRKTSFPNCAGALGGKQVRIVSRNFMSVPSKLPKVHYYAVVFVGLADADYKFTTVDVGLCSGDEADVSFGDFSFTRTLVPGFGNSEDCPYLRQTESLPDAPPENNPPTVDLTDPELDGISDSSGIARSQFAQHMRLPLGRNLPGSTEPFPYVFIGDEDAPPDSNLLKPFSSPHLDDKSAVFNYRLARAQSCADCAFCVLGQKWKLLSQALTVAPDFAVLIIKTVCVLHNFIGERDGFNLEEETLLCELNDYRFPKLEGSPGCEEVRQKLANYFMTPAGEVSWQYHGIGKS